MDNSWDMGKIGPETCSAGRAFRLFKNDDEFKPEKPQA